MHGKILTAREDSRSLRRRNLVVFDVGLICYRCATGISSRKFSFGVENLCWNSFFIGVLQGPPLSVIVPRSGNKVTTGILVTVGKTTGVCDGKSNATDGAKYDVWWLSSSLTGVCCSFWGPVTSGTAVGTGCLLTKSCTRRSGSSVSLVRMSNVCCRRTLEYETRLLRLQLLSVFREGSTCFFPGLHARPLVPVWHWISFVRTALVHLISGSGHVFQQRNFRLSRLSSLFFGTLPQYQAWHVEDIEASTEGGYLLLGCLRFVNFERLCSCKVATPGSLLTDGYSMRDFIDLCLLDCQIFRRSGIHLW